jgi:hypothetical protein
MVADSRELNINPQDSIQYINEKLSLLEQNCGNDLPVFLCLFDKTGATSKVEI